MKNLLERDAAMIWHPYTQHRNAVDPLAIHSGKGAYLYNNEGKSYLDMISSWWVNIHGHGRPELAEAIAVQAKKLDHIQFAGMTHEPAVELADQLLKITGFGNNGRIFYSDNGSTAVEVALKICNQFWSNNGEKRNTLLALRGGYHGDTLGAMSAGSKSGFFGAFLPWMFETVCLEVPFIWNDSNSHQEEVRCLAIVEEVLEKRGGEFCALIVEPLVQGATGMKFHSPEFLKRVCEIAHSSGIPVIFDEVMTGFYRTGSPFAFMQSGVVPDLICLSKGITGGILPLGVTIAAGRFFEAFLGDSFSVALAHGHSFTGNPISCAAALESLRLLEKLDAGRVVGRISAALSLRMGRLSSLFPIEKPRVLGGIAAFEIKSPTPEYSAGAGRPLATYAQEKGVIIRPLGNVIYLMPPYCVTDADLDLAFGVIEEYFNNHS